MIPDQAPNREPRPIDEYPPNIVRTATLLFNTFNRVNQIMHGGKPQELSDEASLRAIRVLCRDVDGQTLYCDLLGLVVMIQRGLKTGSIRSDPIIDRSDETAAEWPVMSLLEIVNNELANHLPNPSSK